MADAVVQLRCGVKVSPLGLTLALHLTNSFAE
jgi:hypothetical protein